MFYLNKSGLRIRQLQILKAQTFRVHFGASDSEIRVGKDSEILFPSRKFLLKFSTEISKDLYANQNTDSFAYRLCITE